MVFAWVLLPPPPRRGRELAGFRVENPRLIPERRMSGYPAPPVAEREPREPEKLSAGLRQWCEACKGGAPSPGSFLHAGGISEAMNLYAVALRTRRRLYYDAANRKITNLADANRYLTREYRKGWSPDSI